MVMSRSMPADPAASPDPGSYQNDSIPLSRSYSTSEGNGPTIGIKQRSSVGGIARHTLGIGLLLVTVILWTASSFLASTIFADNTYSKPYFLVYFNSWFFTSLLLFDFVKRLRDSDWSVQKFIRGKKLSGLRIRRSRDEDQAFSKPIDEDVERPSSSSSNGYLLASERSASFEHSQDSSHETIQDVVSVREIAKLSFHFSVLWFAANYFSNACLEYTTVASTTILTSTSSIWTLIIGAFIGVEVFSLKKLIGVLASLVGILLISGVDISGDHDKHRGTFPHKSPGQIAVGDTMAFFSALLYGIYATVMKKKLGDESRVNMPLFFGMVGLCNTITMLPGFPILHVIGIETFQLPPTKRVFMILVVNALISLASDICWAYAMLLTSPLVVTVGLSLTIPLSLIGQMILNSQTSSAAYWFGALIVLLSFVFINHESKEQEGTPEPDHGSEVDIIHGNSH